MFTVTCYESSTKLHNDRLDNDIRYIYIVLSPARNVVIPSFTIKVQYCHNCNPTIIITRYVSSGNINGSEVKYWS